MRPEERGWANYFIWELSVLSWKCFCKFGSVKTKGKVKQMTVTAR
jgi:hypothetical protein